MRQLRGEDARFVYGESGHANSNITLISIYDPSTARDGRVHFKQLLKHIESRLHLSPIFRQKLLRVPMELDFPYWIEDDDFDLEYHVRHIALPKPGDWRQFCIQASRIHARPLDLSKPLWELYLVEGLDSPCRPTASPFLPRSITLRSTCVAAPRSPRCCTIRLRCRRRRSRPSPGFRSRRRDRSRCSHGRRSTTCCVH